MMQIGMRLTGDWRESEFTGAYAGLAFTNMAILPIETSLRCCPPIRPTDSSPSLIRTPEIHSMRLAICNETFQGWNFREICRFSAELGYEGLEIAPFTLATSAPEISAEQRREVRQAAADHGLEIVGLHWLLAGTKGYYLTDPNPQVMSATADYFRQLIELCAELGGKTMVLGSPQQRNLLTGVTHGRAMEVAAELLKRIVPDLQQMNVTLAVEPLGPEEGDFLNTADAAVELINKVDSPQVRLHLDVKAMSTEQDPYEQVIRRHAEFLHHFHANDPNRQGPGMGAVDFTPIVSALREVGYDGWLSVEVFDYSPGPEVLARESLQYLQRTLAEQ